MRAGPQRLYQQPREQQIFAEMDHLVKVTRDETGSDWDDRRDEEAGGVGRRRGLPSTLRRHAQDPPLQELSEAQLPPEAFAEEAGPGPPVLAVGAG